MAPPDDFAEPLDCSIPQAAKRSSDMAEKNLHNSNKVIRSEREGQLKGSRYNIQP
jgi:hypothetical protein